MKKYSPEIKYYGTTVPQYNYVITKEAEQKKAVEQDVIAFYFGVQENADELLLEKAFNRLIYENDGLRSRFVKTAFGYKVKQYISDYEYEELEKVAVKDWESCEKKMQEFQNTLEISTKDGEKQYRAAIITYDKGQILYVKVTHFCFDGYSCSLAINRLAKYYSAYEKCEELGEPDNSFSIKNFIEENTEYLESERYKKDLRYWKEEIRRHKKIEFPLHARKKFDGIEKDEIKIDGKMYEELLKVSSETGLSKSFMIMSAIGYTIFDLTGYRCFGFSVLSHGRMEERNERIIGCLNNTFLHFFDINPKDDKIENIKKNYIEYIDNLKHSRIPIVQYLFIAFIKTLGRGAKLFNIVFSTLDIPEINVDNKYIYGTVPDYNNVPGQIYVSVYDNHVNEMFISLSYQNRLFRKADISKVKEIFLDNIIGDRPGGRVFPKGTGL